MKNIENQYLKKKNFKTLTPFKNRTPKQNRKKGFQILIFISSLVTSALIYYYFFYESEELPLYLPSIYLNCDEKINNDDYVNCSFQLVDNKDLSNNINPMMAKIKIRGDLNAIRKKKGYRIELSSNTELLGMRKDDDWALFAMYMDPERMRIKTCFELWRSLLPSNPTAILPESKYVNLFLNGKFQGLYLLAEKQDKKLFGLDQAQNNINSSLIFQTKDPTYFKEYETGTWEQDWPNEDEDIYIMDEILTDLFDFVNNTSNETFFDSNIGIYSKFDKMNLIDNYIFNYFILHGDFWFNNYFLIRNTNPNNFFICPWDFDCTFGHTGHEDYEPNFNSESEIREKNELFNRLLNNGEFRQECMERWFELRGTVWGEEHIFEILSEIYGEIEHILEIELRMWKPNLFKKKFNLDDYVSKLFDWIEERLIFCDSYFFNFTLTI